MKDSRSARQQLALQVNRLARISEQVSLQFAIVETECKRTIAMSKAASRIGEVARLLGRAEKVRNDLLIGSKILPECLEK